MNRLNPLHRLNNVQRLHHHLSPAALAAVLLCVSLAPATVPAQPLGDEANAIGRNAPAQDIDAGWPRRVSAPANTTLLMYEPQLDSWDGATLSGRSAVQVEIGQDQPVTRYGIVDFEATTLTDKSTRMVTIESVRVKKADFPSATPAQLRDWPAAVARSLTGRSRVIALDRLEASLAAVQAQQPRNEGPLRNAAPQIIFSSDPAILVFVDGAARFAPLRGTGFERLVNTRPLLLRDASGTHYLKVFDGWMRAPTVEGPWTVLASPPASLSAAAKAANAAQPFDPLTGATTADRGAQQLAGHVPKIVVAHAPTELIVTDGPPRLVPIAGTQLLYVENTTGNIFKDATDNLTYVLVAGRWFSAQSQAGPWTFVAADALPRDFAAIPDESAKENVKASVAGTAQAKEAAIAASVPQTAAVKIAGTSLHAPRFDGAPQWRAIEGTSLRYAANTATPVIEVNARAFYAVENGVWFTAASVNGPWRVATDVPEAIYAIPPSSPLHYVTYVRIYRATADTVYTGYLPGYFGAEVDPVTGVVVYGTGYAYDPWVGEVWYGAPVTYGYGAAMAYTPWTGWAVTFGMGWAWGAATVATGWGWGPYPYWGPWAYPVWGGGAYGPRGGAVAWGPGGWAGYSGNIYRQWGSRASVSRVAGGYNGWTGTGWAGQVGSSYNSRTGIASAGQRGAVGNVYTGNYAAASRGVAEGPRGNVAVGRAGVAGNAYSGNAAAGARGAVYNTNTGQVTRVGAATGAGGAVAHVGNDVYAGRDGNVYRNTGTGWEKHSEGGWTPASGANAGAATREATGGLGEGSTHPLDVDRGARDAGAQRTQQFQHASQNLNHHWGGGGMHGGGFAGGMGGMRGGMGGGMRGGGFRR